MQDNGSLLATSDVAGLRLRLQGRLDAADAGRLRGLLDDAAAEGIAVRVDLSRAGDLGVDVLRVLAAHARDAASRLVLEQPSAAAARALRVSGLDRVLAVLPGRSASEPAAERTA